MLWAHPRSRGENWRARPPPPFRRGSSPLTRGKRQQIARRLEDQGLIPAHAGKTRAHPGRARRRGAHPRSRGENFRDTLMPALWSGSSPLTRGKRDRRCGCRVLGRLIPAHAGKTLPAALRLQNLWAHPRSRGENYNQPPSSVKLSGSSPLTRGKLGARPRDGHLGRLIPAHARKTMSGLRRALRSRAHPRSRGENQRPPGCVCGGVGSSPLTRGKPRPVVLARALAGLIPAHAGKTCFWSCLRAASRAHPRSRGENRLMRPRRPQWRGSSPLTRGKPRV